VLSKSDDELLRATPTEPSVFAEFYRRHEATVLAYFMRRTRRPDLAADLTAETFAAALLAARRYKPGRQPAIAWLFGIARHKLLRSIERERVEDRARRRLGMPLLDLTDDVLREIDRIGSDERVEALLDQLPSEQAAAIRARVLDGASYERIAEAMKCSQAVVRKRVSRGLASLRAATKEDP
jgi:RNA polymerase sigma-70 factor, ECF subfamily